MQYRTSSYAEDVWDTYYYEKNLQGDILAVYSSTGTKLVSYYYDSWGYISDVAYSNGGGNTSARYNPLRYRGYYYDDDLDLYYLATRYYDPETCRFVTADAPAYLGANGDLVSYNLYAYCSNNPVMYKQKSVALGEFFYASYIFSYSSTNSNLSISAEKEYSQSNSSAKMDKLNLFGYELRTSAGWNDSSGLAVCWLGRIGFSSCVTHAQGPSGILYGFAGSTSDIMNWFETTYYGGYGLNLFDAIGAEIQLETLGVSNQINIGRFSVSTSVNFIGATSVVLGWNTDIGNGITRTDGFTVGLNTGFVAAVIVWLYKFVATGDATPVPGLVPA